jgi:hypothetical protein
MANCARNFSAKAELPIADLVPYREILNEENLGASEGLAGVQVQAAAHILVWPYVRSLPFCFK